MTHPSVITVPGHWLTCPRRRRRYASDTVSLIGTLTKEARDLLDMAEYYGVDPHTLPAPNPLNHSCGC